MAESEDLEKEKTVSTPDATGQSEITQVDGRWVCPDPNNPAAQLTWDESVGQWQPQKPIGSDNMTFQGGRWVYSPPGSEKKLEFNNESQTWVEITPTEEDSGSDSDQNDEEDDFAYQLRMEKRQNKKQKTLTGGTFTDADGSQLEWNAEKRAWLPKIDEDFLAKYQAGYGLTPLDTSALEKNLKATTSTLALQEKEERKRRKQERKDAGRKEKSWFEMESDRNTNVYVTGLPPDVTEKEFEDFMAKCGVIAKELDTSKLKLKIYRDSDGNPKGDGRCGYVRKESIDLAMQILDGSEIRPGYKVTVEIAKFELKGEFDPKKRKRISVKAKKKALERQEKLFDWRPDQLRGQRPKSDCTVVIKNLFKPDDFLGNATLLFDLQELVKSFCAKFGDVRKATIFDTNPEGVATITFATPEMADDCLTMTDYRQMRGRQVRAERWDGHTKFKVEESDEDRQKRIAAWEAQL